MSILNVGFRASDLMLNGSLYKIISNDDPLSPISLHSVYPLLAIVSVYIFFVFYLGPMLMKPYKAFKMNKVLIAYNMFIVFLNGYVSFNIFAHCIPHYKELCTHNHDEVEYHVKMLFRYLWFYYLSKYVDLLDTVFFILRKKDRQVSFLHVFHHSIVLFICWGGIKLKIRGAYICIIVTCNSFIHVLTYSYYTLAACGPKVQKYLWWKKHLTTVQVAQFVVILVYFLIAVPLGCEKLDVIVGSLICFISILMFLFSNFYWKNYKTKTE